MSFKPINGLMRHLRNNGIAISGSTQKKQLRNTGYFHGYKGYRFFGTSSNRLPFSSYDEVYATIQYDSQLKALLYGKMMFIETAVKNVALKAYFYIHDLKAYKICMIKLFAHTKMLQSVSQLIKRKRHSKTSSI